MIAIDAPIAALVSERIDGVSGRATRNRNDALAVALGLRLAANDLCVLHAGSMSQGAARDYLALGAAKLDIIECCADDPVPHLASALKNVPVVLTGSRARDQFGSGVLPYRLAAALGRPVVGDVVEVQAEAAAWCITQALPKGARRKLRVIGPVVLAIANGADWPLRHAYVARVAGRIERHPVAAVKPPPPGPQRVPAARRVMPLAAMTTGRGHDRMHAAVGGSTSARGIVIATGTPEDKARALLDYLRKNALIDF